MPNKPHPRSNPTSLRRHSGESGASLIMVLLILVVVSIIGVGATQIALMAERGSRNDRDKQVAWGAAEAAMLDAEFDIYNPASTRHALFDGTDITQFVDGCGASGNSRGLCALSTGPKPAWLTVDFMDTSSSAPTVAHGTFTGRSFAASGVGLSPKQAPRYVIEPILDPVGSTKGSSYAYRVTIMGFGPRAETQSVMQMIFRI